jgi:ketosteroid isomerase-like protein
MKKFLLVCLSLMVFGFCQAQDQQAIAKVLETQRLAWNKGDIEEFMQGYWQSDSLLFVGSKGPKYGWQTTLDNYKKNYPNRAAMGQLTFDVKQIQLLDARNAFVLGGWRLKREKDEPGGYFTLWFRKIKGAWKIVCDHTT